MDSFPVLVPVSFPGGMDAAIVVPGVVTKGVVGANAEGQWAALSELVVVLWILWVTECARSTNNEHCTIGLFFGVYG